MRPLAACCQFNLGALSRRAGRAAHAEQHLNAAVLLFRSMEMGVWQARTEALLGH